MNRLKTTILLIATLLCGSCIDPNSQGNAKSEDLTIMSGIDNHKLMLDGTAGVNSIFTFKANHDWKIIDYKNFSCSPSSGSKTAPDELAEVIATPLQNNNTADTIFLSDLNFKLLSTRFVGISAYQLPQIRLPRGNKVYIDALSGSSSTIVFISSSEDVEIVTSGEISAEISTQTDKKEYKEYTITVTAQHDNTLSSDQIIGEIEFLVGGVKQESKIEVIQISAIVLDRSLVYLPSRAGGSNMLSIDTDFEVDILNSSKLFTVNRVSKNVFSITATTDNNQSNDISLGYIKISLADIPNCEIEVEVKQRKAKASQTIIAHFIGTALKYYYENNITKMLEALNADIQGDAQIVAVTTDTANSATIYELRYDSTLGTAVKEKVKELNLPTPYNTDVFDNILHEAIKFAPAEKYSLVIGSHGLAWIPKVTSSATLRTLLNKGFSSVDLWLRDKNAEMTRHLGDNEPTRYNISEIARAIESNNVKFEYILFDACFMGNIESAYELRNATKHIIGSPCEIMGAGFPYALVVPYMLTQGGTSYDLDKICRNYVDYYRSSASTPSACIAVTHTETLEALAEAMKAVNSATIKSDFSLDNVQYYEGQDPHSFYDLGDIVEKSCANSDVAAAFKEQLDKSVTSRYHTDQFYSAYGSHNKYYHDINSESYSGITTSAMVEHYAYDWSQTAWYKATH